MKRLLGPICSLGFLIAAAAHQSGQDVLPEYRNATPNDPVAALQKYPQALQYDEGHGYLRSVLHRLNIDPSSQVLVFSKTSLQTPYIGPLSPRAIYFNDRCYVGWIPGAPNIEIAAVDPVLGPQFYTLANRPSGSPRIVRQVDECLQCHDSAMTGNVPGVMTRSVYAGADGTLFTAAGSFLTTSSSPLSERWGGWYVTGRSGASLHMGNEPARGDEANPTLDRITGTNVTDLSSYFNTGVYLSAHSDIVALMVMEQQTTIENAVTHASYETRAALKYADDMVKFGLDKTHLDAETAERIDHACEPLVRALVGADEPLLSSPLAPSNEFAKRFALSAPADAQGRRLSELDLQTRVLKYPCSPMIYSAAFRGMPPQAKDRVMLRLREVLSGKDGSVHLYGVSPARRAAALSILDATWKD